MRETCWTLARAQTMARRFCSQILRVAPCAAESLSGSKRLGKKGKRWKGKEHSQKLSLLAFSPFPLLDHPPNSRTIPKTWMSASALDCRALRAKSGLKRAKSLCAVRCQGRFKNRIESREVEDLMIACLEHCLLETKRGLECARLVERLIVK